MSRPLSSRWLVILAAVPACCLLALLAGCGGGPVTAANSGLRPAEEGAAKTPEGDEAKPETPATPDTPPKPQPIRVGGTGSNEPTTPGGEAGRLSVPEAPETDLTKAPGKTLPELAKYIDAINDRMAQIIQSIQENGEDSVDPREILVLKQAQVNAAEEILASPEPGEYRTMAIGVKLEGLQLLGKFGNDAAAVAARKFAETLLKDKDPEVAETARLAIFSSDVEKLSDGITKLYREAMEKGGDRPELTPALVTEVDKVAADAKLLLDDPLSGDKTFYATFEAFNAMLLARRIDHADMLLTAMDAKYGKSKNGRIAFQVGKMQESMPWQLRLDVGSGNKAYLPRVVATLEKQLNEKSIKIQDVYQAFYMIELGGHLEELKKLVVALRKAYKDHPLPKMTTEVNKYCDLVDGRLALIGQPFPVEGVLAEGGAAFDWKPYAGKVVLIDFWATWCPTCVEEIPELHKIYEKYHARGFDIVGINMDDEIDALDRFRTSTIKKLMPGVDQLPWVSVVQSDMETNRDQNPNAIRAGVKIMPLTILVGADGKIITTMATGKRLDKLLAELLPPAKSTTDPTTPPVGAPAENKTGLRSWMPEETFVVFAEEEPAAPTTDLSAINPYTAGPDLSVAELADFILNMQEKPRTIQLRPGFREAIVEAAERIVAAKGEGKPLEIARTAQFQFLHRDASLGDEKADTEMTALAEKCKADTNAKIARYVALVTIEREALAAPSEEKIEAEKLNALLTKIKTYCEKEKLTSEHLRLASATVAVINRLPVAEREAKFEEFGKLFATSKDKQLARYGKKIAAKPEAGGGASDLVGKPMELKGTPVDGSNFQWDTYRGKFVIIDFWATWCGPCRKAMPKVEALYEKHKDKGVAAVGVSLDEDADELATFLEENPLPWVTLNGEESSDVAKKYGVRGIPTLMLIDKQGKILAVTHSPDELEVALEKALAAPPAAPAPAPAPPKG